MLAQERYDKIISLINKKGNVKTVELIEEFKVSFETVRRDLEFLEKSKKLKRVYGGAVQINPSRKYKDFVLREKEFNPQKVEIAEKALELITDGQAIYDLKCSACHKLGTKRVVGPGFKGVTDRRKPEWILNMVTNVEVMLEEDPEARKLLEECLTRMPNQNLSRDDARAVLEFLYSLEAG